MSSDPFNFQIGLDWCLILSITSILSFPCQMYRYACEEDSFIFRKLFYLSSSSVLPLSSKPTWKGYMLQNSFLFLVLTYQSLTNVFLLACRKSSRINTTLAVNGLTPLLIARLDHQDAIARLNLLKLIKVSDICVFLCRYLI